MLSMRRIFGRWEGAFFRRHLARANGRGFFPCATMSFGLAYRLHENENISGFILLIIADIDPAPPQGTFDR